MELRGDKNRSVRDMFALEVAALTNVGLIRKINEDSVLIGAEVISEEDFGPRRFALFSPTTVLIVADGMGGHHNGALASRTALSSICKVFPQGTETWRWENVVHLANDAVYDAMDHSLSLKGMGTTIAGVAIGEDQIVYFNVGDSRVYRHSGDGLIRLSQDDVPLGGGPQTRRRSHQITQALGGRFAKTPVCPHVGTCSGLNSEDTLLICSDGLTDMVSESSISRIIVEEPDLEQCARRLLSMALDAGGRDNISIIVARLPRS